jgi:Domain of unknown function (DUF4037)
VSGEFVPGLALAKGFYADVVAPLVSNTPHSAALLGWGSDVLGFDTLRSTDHGWGPRLQVFVDEADVGAVDELLETHLPELYRGWPVHFGWDEHPVVKRVEVTSLEAWLEQQVGFDPRPAPTPQEWLTTPQQSLLEIVSGDVFHDGLAELASLRVTLEWYPRDVWLWLLAAQWRRLDQEEAFRRPRCGGRRRSWLAHRRRAARARPRADVLPAGAPVRAVLEVARLGVSPARSARGGARRGHGRACRGRLSRT